MFARLRMFLKQCSLVQPCTAGFGWHGRQWVKQNMYVMKVEKRLFLTVAKITMKLCTIQFHSFPTAT